MSKLYRDLQLVLGKRDYWLGAMADIGTITPEDIFLTRVMMSSEYVEPEANSGLMNLITPSSSKEPKWKIIIEGKSFSVGSVTNFGNALKGLKFVDQGKVKFTNITSPAPDPKYDKPVTSFTFEIDCNPPAAAQPQ